MNDLLCAGTGTAKNSQDDTLTMEKLNEALELIKALAPKGAPEGTFLIKGLTGLKIMKNDMLPPDTVMVSKRLFDMIYESSST
ncbi:hypothetical protein [Sedimenticola selenatireducens]|uniref:Uncharacterized protein n=1 Tax=Sedimenticola selenatireducens TaxID=191960 RepID=A0A558E129_9GAMM|nr:hypothetical protein [Sedimenticola selenatireducens]TVO75104.1 hypothetical protein FHP88_08815 [Sedimenticola selenatireducens]TVT67042.1 MAG: hypothetical protein FHK78_01545 [Sedimenticola selenatireducens]